MAERKWTIKRALVVLLSTLCIGGLVYILIVALMMDHAMRGLCGNQLLSSTPSPNFKLKAVAFERDCGAAASTSIQISILRERDQLTERDHGNVLTMDDLPRQGYRVDWKGDEQLVIHFSEKPEIFLQEKEVRGVKISYEPA